MEEIQNTEATQQAGVQEGPKMIEAEKVQAILEQANQKLHQAAMEIQRLNQLLTDKTLDYYFKVLEHPDQFDTDFILYSADTVTKALTPRPEEEQTTAEKTNAEVEG